MKQQSLLLSVGASSSAGWAGNYIYFYLNSHSFTSLYFIATHTTVSHAVCALRRHAWTPLTPNPLVSNNSIRKQQTSLACSWWERGSTNIWISNEYNRQHWSSIEAKKEMSAHELHSQDFVFINIYSVLKLIYEWKLTENLLGILLEFRTWPALTMGIEIERICQSFSMWVSVVLREEARSSLCDLGYSNNWVGMRMRLIKITSEDALLDEHYHLGQREWQTINGKVK